MKYRKKPIIIDAIQWDGDNTYEIIHVFPEMSVVQMYNPHELLIRTKEGMMNASIGDYIIKGIKGEFYPCKREIFEETYEKVE